MRKRPANHAVVAVGAERLVDVDRFDFCREEISVRRDDARDLSRVLAHELDAEPSDAVLRERRHEGRRALGRGVKDGVAAADVGFDRMIEPGAIAQRHLVVLAGAAAGASP